MKNVVAEILGATSIPHRAYYISSVPKDTTFFKKPVSIRHNFVLPLVRNSTSKSYLFVRSRVSSKINVTSNTIVIVPMYYLHLGNE